MGYTELLLSHILKVMLLITLIGSVNGGLAQQVPMSQYYVSPMNINPALVGSSTHPLVTTHHRSQWNTYAHRYPINIASAIYPIIQQYPTRMVKGGLGLKFSHEVAGLDGWLKNTELQIAGAYNLSLDYEQDHVISFGVATAYRQRNIDPEGLHWGSQYDHASGYDPSIIPSVSLIHQRLGYALVEAGAVWSYKAFKNRLLNPWQWLGGFAVAHMNRPDISFTDQMQRLPMLVRGHMGATYTKNQWKIHPQTLVLWQQSNYHLNLGAYAQYQLAYAERNSQKTLLLGGLWYRWNDAIAVSGGVSHRNIQMAFSMDFSRYPSLHYVSASYAWEASLVYVIKSAQQTTKKRFTPLI